MRKLHAVVAMLAMAVCGAAWADDAMMKDAPKPDAMMKDAKSDAMMMSPEVAASPEAVKPIGVGQMIPDATLTDLEGKSVKLREVVKAQPAVLIFYRGSWCPFCNTHLAKMEGIQGQLKDLGYQIIAISIDSPEFLKKTMDKNALTYTLLSDGDGSTIKAFGLAYKVDDALNDKLMHYGVDLTKQSGHDTHTLPVPAVYVVASDGTIKFEHHDADYKVRLEPEKVIEAAKAAK